MTINSPLNTCLISIIHSIILLDYLVEVSSFFFSTKLANMIVNNFCLFFSVLFCVSLCSNFLFLFRDGQCPEYSGEEQAICAVGLVKSKPGIFVEAIQYLLVLATPAEVGVFLVNIFFLTTSILVFMFHGLDPNVKV